MTDEYYWVDLDATFTIKTKENMEREWMVGKEDAKDIMSYLMYASERYMCKRSITDDVSYFKDHPLPQLTMYTYDSSILGGCGIFQYKLEVDLINHVVTIMEHCILTSLNELFLKSKKVFKESKNHTARILIDFERLEALYPTTDNNDPYQMYNDLQDALFMNFETVYNTRAYTEITLNDLGMLTATKDLLKAFQSYLKFADENTTPYSHEEVMELLVEQMIVISPRDFRESVEGYQNFRTEE